MAESAPPKLVTSIVSYNTRADLDACLESVYAGDIRVPFSVVVVDNGSTDNSQTLVHKKYPEARLIETGENLGYGRANNRALLGHGGKYYLIINSDIVLEKGSVQRLLARMESDPEIGIAMGALLNPDGSMQMTWAAGELTVASVLWEQTFLARLFPKSPLFGDYFRTGWDHKTACFLPQACGAFMLVRAELYNRLGGFDPAYFMYCEDTDLSRRVRDAGYKIAYEPQARAVHGHAKSSEGALRPQMIAEHNRSRCYYFTKFYTKQKAREARRIMIAGAWLRVLAWGAAGLIKPAARERAKGFLRVLGETKKIQV